MNTNVYTNATVVTCDAANTIAEAVAVDDGRIAAVGAADEVRRAAGRKAVVVDLDGATVLPGFIDTHPLLMHYSVIAEPLVDLGDAVDLADIAARITAHAANIPAGQWIMATPVGEPHYFLRRSYRDLTQGQLPDRTIMDAAAPNPPRVHSGVGAGHSEHLRPQHFKHELDAAAIPVIGVHSHHSRSWFWNDWYLAFNCGAHGWGASGWPAAGCLQHCRQRPNVTHSALRTALSSDFNAVWSCCSH